MSKCKKHKWELVKAYTWVTPRYAKYRCKKCGMTIESNEELKVD